MIDERLANDGLWQFETFGCLSLFGCLRGEKRDQRLGSIGFFAARDYPQGICCVGLDFQGLAAMELRLEE
jgi:hypothetical protein